jgi:hypothetical protein
MVFGYHVIYCLDPDDGFFSWLLTLLFLLVLLALLCGAAAAAVGELRGCDVL